ncbi:major facilitator superfamily transporter multidrug resistance [Grosmannia clavigera kw1407]|uniref:Major facilitator superfamily transporter multidrug resistance n=1 Tax=Grosmannia clavigera (strain kw1407 / UAMH 11150) TaxID=655863 RepID=F0XI22_GROCL|nr:major facilitator superfamily transporter multidrug resistance [Grosmannia clavigera kw1407]EFX03069.1 major facilitator superfamily transporter multidrug resistance [Grosmannia clavigera kw1407]
MLDSSIVATSLLTIGEELGYVKLLNWVALAYTLAYLGCAVIFARSSDVIGRRNAYLVAFVIFLAFSLGSGFSRTMYQLITFRTLQGIGGSGLYSLSMTIWPEVAPSHLQQHIASLAGVVIAVAGVLGPVLGGILTHYASWSGPIAAVAIVVFLLSWPKAETLPPVQLRPWRELDFVGSFLLIAAAVLVTYAFQNSSADGLHWGHALFLAPLITGVFCWVALFVWEWSIERRRAHILAAFPMKLIRNRVYLSALIHTMFTGFPFFTVVYVFPLRLQVVNGKSALIAGVMLLPMLGGVSIGSYVSGAINARSNRVFEILVVSSCLLTLGCGLETTLSASVSLPAKALGFLPFIGLGVGLAAAASTIVASSEAPEGEHAPSQGILAQIRVFGGSIGIAASSAVLAAQEVKRVDSMRFTSAGAPISTQDSPEAVLIREIYSDAFRGDMRVCIVISAVSIVAACGTYRRNRKPIFSSSRLAEDGSNGDEEKTKSCGGSDTERSQQGSDEAASDTQVTQLSKSEDKQEDKEIGSAEQPELAKHSEHSDQAALNREARENSSARASGHSGAIVK